MIKYSFFIFIFIAIKDRAFSQSKIIPGAERMDVYIPLLKGKSIALFANQTSMVGDTHLADTLQKKGIKIVKIFSPEHGFRGKGDAGEEMGNYIDKSTGIEVVSLYGAHNKPTDAELKDVDVMVFDIQDVGVRFYTYISSLEYYIEASLENAKPLVILDRPNPNGFYVDGPVLDKKFKSFVGMQSVPIVYGMTIGEYAMMITQEHWLDASKNKKFSRFVENGVVAKAKNNKINIKSNHEIISATLKIENNDSFYLKIICNKNYDHNSKYVLPVKPSPNLPEIQSVYWYPSTCFFEATVLSEGRGTGKPFQFFGHPSLPKTLFSFTPTSREGAKDPKLKDQLCYGWNVYGTPAEVLQNIDGKIQLKWILQAYALFPQKDKFFLTPTSLNRLAGNDILMQQVINGTPEDEIRKSWEPALGNFKKIRKKYLLYEDFIP